MMRSPSAQKLSLFAGLLAVAAYSRAQTDLRADSVFLSNAEGFSISPELGKPVYIGLRFTVTGTSNSSYRYRIETPYGRLDSSRLGFGITPGEYWVTWGPVPTLMDGPMEVKVTLDPDKKVNESNRTNNSLSFRFTPVPPGAPIESYNLQTLYGRLGLDISWKGSSAIPESVTLWMPITRGSHEVPESDGALDVPGLETLISERFGQPIASRTFAPISRDSIREERSVGGVSSSVRVNRSRLIELGAGTSPEVAEWLEPETLVESDRPEIRSFAAGVLASAPLATSTFERAEALYRGVLKRGTYESKPGASASALQMLRKKKGDCGGFSSLFVALCRASGIPARAVGGFSLGSNAWHVWAEFHVAGAGWIPVDPAFAEGRLPKGSDLPIYFGVIPERNERLVTMVGMDRLVAGRSLPMLQSPAVFWSGSGVKLNRATPFCKASFMP